MINHRQVYQVIRQALRKGTDKKLVKNSEELRAEGFGWRYDGLGDWQTDAIFERLQGLGIDTDQHRFEEQARAAGRCFELEEQWRDGTDIDDRTPWDDFPFLACEELWRRLTPQLLCPEIVAARLEQTIERLTEDGDSQALDVGHEGIDAAMVLMDYLERHPAEGRQKAFDEVLGCSTYDFGEWLVDIALDYGHDHVERVRRIAEVMSETEYAENLWTDLACSLERAGLCNEAEELVERNLQRWPNDVWVRIKSGDVFRDLGDTDTAVQCYSTALRLASTPYDWEGVAERFEPLLSGLGRCEEWKRLKQKHAKPANPPIIPFSSAPAGASREIAPIDPKGPIGVITSGPSPQIISGSPAPSFPNAKVGRNSPCPCGSGRKYKKCCMGRE